MFPTDPPPNVPDVTLSCINSTSFIVQWTDLSEYVVISRYEVSITFSDGETVTVCDEYDECDGSFTFSGSTVNVSNVTVVAFDNTNRKGDSTVVEIPHDSDRNGKLHFFTYTPYFCIVFISFMFYYFMACSAIPMIVFPCICLCYNVVYVVKAFWKAQSMNERGM